MGNRIRSSGSGGADISARAGVAVNSIAIQNVIAPAATAKTSGSLVWGEDQIWQANKDTAVPDPATDANYEASPDWEKFSGEEQIGEIVYKTAAFSGAAEIGQKTGYDISVSPWKEYYSDGEGSVWGLRPVAVVPANIVHTFDYETFAKTIEPATDNNAGDRVFGGGQVRRELIYTGEIWKPTTNRINPNPYYEDFNYNNAGSVNGYAVVPLESNPKKKWWAKLLENHTSAEAVDYSKWELIREAFQQTGFLNLGMIPNVTTRVDMTSPASEAKITFTNYSSTTNAYLRLPSLQGGICYDKNNGMKPIDNLRVAVPPLGHYSIVRGYQEYTCGLDNPESVGTHIEEYTPNRLVTADEVNSLTGYKFTVTDTTDPFNPTAEIYKVLRPLTLPATFDENYDDGSGKVYAVAAPDPIIPDPETGTLATLNIGTATTPKSYSEKDIADYVEGKKNVRNFSSYGEANAEGAQPRDTIFIIGMKREIWARTETTGSFLFPGTGVADNHWFKDNAPDPQSLILDNIEVTLFSNGTNASSSVGITFVDKDGNNYPASAWAYSANLVQHTGGTDTIITDKAPFSGTIGIGRNKQGPVKFYYVGDNPNGLSAINTVDANNGTTQGVVVTYQGTNYNDAFANVGAVAAGEPLYWTTSQEVTASDQAAPLIDATEYLAGTIFSNPEPDNTDPDYQTWFNWRVNDGETIADTDIPTGAEAEFLAVKGKLTRFGVGSQPSISLGYLAPVDRVVSAPDPIPSTGGAFERVLYQGNTTSDIWVMDNAGANPVKVTNPSAADWADGVRVDDLATGDTYQYDRGTNNFVLLPLIAGELPIVRYTADGAIQDIDHRAIFETGAVNMTLSASTIDRVIQMVSEGPTTVITANGAEQFTGSLGTSTDSKLTLNDTFKWATIIGRTAGGWSQYVGQVGIPDGVDIATPTKFKAGTRLVQNGIMAGPSVTFPEAFKVGTTPTVIPIALDPGDNVNVTLQNVTNTGFTSWIVRNESDVGIGAPIMHWIAIGEAA